MRFLAVIAAAAACAGCTTTETVQFRAKPQQEAMIRDGQSALLSRKKNSLILIRPAARQFVAGGRPVFVVGLNNLSNTPQTFHVAQVEVTQFVNGQAAALRVISYEDLVAEERGRQVAAAIFTGLAVGANAAAASQAGYYSRTSTVHTPRGTYQVHSSGYSPTAAAIAQTNASIQNEAMISATVERGRQNLAMLEQHVIKDNTLMPGEWYGGQLHIQPPASVSNEQKTYQIVITIGADRHEVEVSQGSPQ